MTREADGIPRSVKPRSTKTPDWLPIIAIDNQDGCYLLERTGEIGPLTELYDLFMREPQSIVIAQSVAELVADLDGVFDGNPRWQYRLTPMRREVHRPGTRKPPAVVDTVVNFFGFRGPEKVNAAGFPTGKFAKGVWFFPVDPYVFSRVPVTKFMPDNAPRVQRFMRWGQDLRAFCQDNCLRVTTTGGGLAGQLLRDPRFYPVARRKVPRKTNLQARDQLPGNYYRLMVPENENIGMATYLDMASAHHHVAAGLTFPHADHLMRRGDWRTTDPTDATVPRGRPQWEPGTQDFYNLLRRSHGLLKIRLRVPAIPEAAFPLPFMEREGLVSAFVYTNELDYIMSLGAQVEGIDAAWTSFRRDVGLNRYAAWCLSELATMDPVRKAWAKPVLLSAYGILAAKPKNMEMAFKRSRGGKLQAYPAGKTVLHAHAKTLGVREAPTANVIQRGMIEAATRIAALELARTMTTQGHRVLSIYADAVFVQPSGPMPLLPAPWSVKGELTNLVFLNPVSFTSDQMRKLPGVPLGPGRTSMRQARAKIRAREALSVRATG